MGLEKGTEQKTLQKKDSRGGGYGWRIAEEDMVEGSGRIWLEGRGGGYGWRVEEEDMVGG